MLHQRLPMRRVAFIQILAMLFLACMPLMGSADMIETGSVVADQQLQHDREELRAMLDRDEVKATLERMGVDRAQVEERISNLTQQELASFNDQLAQAPAGEGVVGIIVLFVLVFIVTDMLCATNIFSFVRCIN
ncbi:MAG: PA2779 family protein [Pseudomonadota bacterium]